MTVLYNGLLLVIAALALPFVALWLCVSARARLGLGERLDLAAANEESTAAAPSTPADGVQVWVHAASVGEAEAALPLVEQLGARGVAVRATTLTWTGRARLRERAPETGARLVPLDLPGSLGPRRLARRWRPGVLVLVETELWPNLIWAGRGVGARVIMIGARISDRTLGRYRRLRPWIGPLLSGMWSIGARSEEDRARLVSLGADPERTHVIGDLKLDRSAPPEPEPALREAIGPGPLLVGGSTHPGEDELLLSSWSRLRETVSPSLRLLLAPRHPERAGRILTLVAASGARGALRSAGAAAADVVVLDTLGELGPVYRLADIVFVGGTLVPVGGHNLVEPVQAGRVVVHGPHIENQRAQARLLAPLGVLRRADRPEELTTVFSKLWTEAERNGPARDARAALERHRGTAARARVLICEALAARAGD